LHVIVALSFLSVAPYRILSFILPLSSPLPPGLPQKPGALSLYWFSFLSRCFPSFYKSEESKELERSTFSFLFFSVTPVLCLGIIALVCCVLFLSCFSRLIRCRFPYYFHYKLSQLSFPFSPHGKEYGGRFADTNPLPPSLCIFPVFFF